MKIGIIGLGHLSKSFVVGLLKRDFDKNDIYFTNRSEESRIKNSQELKIKAFANNRELVKNSDIIILSVKPKDYRLIEEFKDDLKGKTLISFLIQVDIQRLEKILPNTNIVRAMPNIAMQVNSSATALVFSENTPELKKKEIIEIFSKLGSVYEVKEEEFDAFSAVSSSGIAFVAYLVETFEKSSEKYGFEKELQEKIALDTFKSALGLISEGKIKAEELKEMVATKGGSTIEGLIELENYQVGEKIIKSIDKSHQKVKNKI